MSLFYWPQIKLLRECIMGEVRRGSTFDCDTSCAACCSKLVPCHTGVEASIRFGCVPYAKVAVGHNIDPVVKNTELVLSYQDAHYS